jgi:hypothetical protein
VCVPGCTVEETFAGHNPVYRQIYDEIMTHLDALGPVHADAVQVGVFLKAANKIGEIRPKARSLQLYLSLPRTVEDPRIARHMRTAADKVGHIIKLTTLSDVDDKLRDWLTEAYVFAAHPS